MLGKWLPINGLRVGETHEESPGIVVRQNLMKAKLTGAGRGVNSVDAAAELVREGIREGRFVPGQRLIAGDLAALSGGGAGPFREALVETYTDNRHPNRAAAIQSLRAYLRYYGSLHLFSVVRSIDLDPAGNRAGAVVFVALTAVPVESVGQLVSVKADAFRFDVQLVFDEDRWQVAGSEWRRIASDDFL